MTLLDLYPVLLFLGVLGLAVLWEARRLAAARVARRRLATAGLGLLVVLMVISIPARLMMPGESIPSGRLLSWQLNRIPGLGFDSTSAQTTTLVQIEVEHPYCVGMGAGPWLADPIVTYTPWSVTVTMHMDDAPGCTSGRAPHDGPLPLVGGYLTGLFVPVQLSEPLRGRMLFDGSSFPPAARLYP